MTAYFIIRNNGSWAMYGNLTLLCECEGLGYSKFVKYFGKKWHYKDDVVEIWKGKVKRGTRSS